MMALHVCVPLLGPVRIFIKSVNSAFYDKDYDWVILTVQSSQSHSAAPGTGARLCSSALHYLSGVFAQSFE